MNKCSNRRSHFGIDFQGLSQREEGELNLTEMSNQQLLQFVALNINKASK